MSVHYGAYGSDPQLGPFFGGISTNFNPVANQWQLNNSVAVDMRSVNNTSNGYVTNATIVGNYLPGGRGAVVTVYQGLANEGPLQKAQDFVHEAVHGYAGVNDQDIAAAAGVPGPQWSLQNRPYAVRPKPAM